LTKIILLNFIKLLKIKRYKKALHSHILPKRGQLPPLAPTWLRHCFKLSRLKKIELFSETKKIKI
jgi:hypothetical protein